MPKQQQQPPQSRRLDAYIRVSAIAGRSGEQFISPDVQEERIRAWATANGHEIVMAHHELDVSGGSMDRPMLNEVMRRIEAGETDGVVVFKLDRFGRTLVAAIQLIERISSAGALFASVSDGFDITTPTGRLVLRILLSLAEFELERIRENWTEARRRATERGIHVAARPPFGYRRAPSEINPATGRPIPTPLVPDDVEAPLVAEVFRRRAAGETWAAIRDYLNGTGVRPRLSTKNGWCVTTLYGMVQNRAYLGVALGGLSALPDRPGAHLPLVDEATWQAAQQRRSRHIKTESSTVLRGLVRCAGCRYTMTPQRESGTTAIRFVCARAPHGGDCPQPTSITTLVDGWAALDDLVVELMFARLERIEFAAVDVRDDVTQCEQALAAARHELETAATDMEAEQILGREMWLKRVAVLRAAVDNAQAELDRALTVAGRHDRPVAELRQQWPAMSLDEQRDHVARALQMLFVRPPRPGKRVTRWSEEELRRRHLLDRVHPVWATDPTPEIPRQGYRGYRIHPFVFPPDANPGDVGVVAA